MRLEAGTLWRKIQQRTESALRQGALLPIHTESVHMMDSGVDFLVRQVSSLVRKSEQKRPNKGFSTLEGSRPNPFLPYEAEMFVTDISDTHVCLLNKFNVIDFHILIVTREFEEQDRLLNRKDMEAILACLAEFNGLAFYNGGTIAGASQPHKHLQMIALPMQEPGPSIPIEPLLPKASLGQDLSVLEGLPFRHCFARFSSALSDDIAGATEVLFGLYRRMLQEVGLNPISDSSPCDQSGPYNLLLTREWMLLVPRARECFDSISVNSLGFAGALLVQNEEQMRLLKQCGGMAVLKHTALGR